MNGEADPGRRLIEGKYTVNTVLRAAQKLAARRTADTQLIDKKHEDAFPKFGFTELTMGRVLGRGFFCVVNEITHIDLLPSEERSTLRLEDEQQIYTFVHDRAFMEAHCRRGKDRDCRYALKRLQRVTCERSAVDYMNGLVDLAIEASFLAVIRHPNIIKMRAMGVHGPFSSQENFFVVLDRLYDTLSVRITKWKKQRPGVLHRRRRKEFWSDRLMVAHGIASALAYLHEMRIIYRDLKPDNIGFDVRGDVKIFDFGLSREFDPSKKDRNGLYRLTENTGSPRYMAPEVALGQPYNERCDVYSFSLLLWHMIKLEAPFAHFTLNQLQDRVYRESLRPKCDGISSSVANTLKRGWGPSLQRPPMSQLITVLQEQAGICPEEAAAAATNAMTPSILSAAQLGYPIPSAPATAQVDVNADASIYQRTDGALTLEETFQQLSHEETPRTDQEAQSEPVVEAHVTVETEEDKAKEEIKLPTDDLKGKLGFLLKPPANDAPSLHRFEI